MPITVLEHNTDSVYLYAGSNRDVHHPELESVTYIDDIGTVHTIHVPRELGFTDPHDIIAAVHRAHESQLQYTRRLEHESGALDDAQRAAATEHFYEQLRALSPSGRQAEQGQQGQQGSPQGQPNYEPGQGGY